MTVQPNSPKSIKRHTRCRTIVWVYVVYGLKQPARAQVAGARQQAAGRSQGSVTAQGSQRRNRQTARPHDTGFAGPAAPGRGRRETWQAAT